MQNEKGEIEKRIYLSKRHVVVRGIGDHYALVRALALRYGLNRNQADSLYTLYFNFLEKIMKFIPREKIIDALIFLIQSTDIAPDIK